tara:strand:+ start:460 stop:663 length:204 start_codon:yes stop_codon:yes gene_type:complete
MNDSEQKPVNIDEMNAQQSLEAIWTLINKAASKGCYSIDESYVIKVLFNKVSKKLSESTVVKNDHDV